MQTRRITWGTCVLALVCHSTWLPGLAQVPPWAQPTAGARPTTPPPAPRFLEVEVVRRGPQASAAGTYYVAPGGQGNACTSSAPCGTINAAVTRLTAGETVIVRGGTYTECIGDTAPPAIPAGKSWAAPTTIQGAPGEAVWLRAPQGCPGGGGLIEVDQPHSRYIRFVNLKIEAQIDGQTINSFGVGIASSHIRLEHVEVQHARTGVKIEGQHNELHAVEVRYSGFPVCPSPTGCHGIYVSGNHNLLSRVRSRDNNCFGVTLSREGGAVQGNTIQHSEFARNGCGGILAYPSNTVVGNRLWHNHNGMQLGSETEAYDNVLYDNGESGIVVTGSRVKVKNNISIGHRWDILNHEASQVDADANICSAVGVPDTVGCTQAAPPSGEVPLPLGASGLATGQTPAKTPAARPGRRAHP